MSRAYSAMTRLLEMWQTAVAASEYAGTVDIYLGPLISGDPDDAVFIGFNGDPTGDFEMATHMQNWAAIGQRRQDDIFDVHCSILTMAGITDADGMAAAMGRLYGIWRCLTTAIKADPSMGLGPGTTEDAPVWVADVRSFSSYVPTDEERGVMPRIAFDVHVETRV